MSRDTKLSKKLYEDRNETGDVTFIVDSEPIRVHRCVLAAFSPKYKAQLYDTELEKDNIKIENTTAAAFHEFLQFFYSESLDSVKLTVENIDAVLDLAKQSLVDEFVKKCVDFLKQELTVANSCTIYRLAILHDIKELKDACEQNICNHTAALFATGNFNFDRDTLIQILKLEWLSCPESQVFDACISWARVACEEKDIDAENPANLRAVLGDDAVTQIRFGSISIEDFVNSYKSLEGFFMPDETKEIMYLIGKLKDFKPQKFNATPRGLWSNLVKSDFECNRILSAKELNDNTYNKTFYFTCNRTIELVGIALNTVWYLNDVDDIKIIINKVGRDDVIEIRPKYTVRYTTNKQEAIVVFEKTISVPLGTQVYIQRPRLRLDVDLIFELANKVNDDGYEFKFFGNFPMITRLFYNDCIVTSSIEPLLGKNYSPQ